MSELPADWALVSFSEVAELVRGVSYKKNESDINPREGLIPILRANNIQNGNLVLHDLVYVPTEKVKEKQLIKQGDIIVAMSSGSKKLVGKSGVCDKRITASFGTFCGLIRAKSNCYPRYLGWFTQSKYYTDTISNLSKGVNINNLKPAHFEELQIPLPTLAEQKCIADKLDSVLAKVEAAQARLDKIPAILKRFRQSVLAAATSGELTREWRENINLIGVAERSFNNIEDLKKNLINSKLSKKDLKVAKSEPANIPLGWNIITLGGLASKITDGEHKTPKRAGAGKYLLSARNVRDGYISLEKVDYVDDDEFNKLRKRCNPDKGDILISCSGSVGRVSLCDKDDEYVMVRSAALVKTDGMEQNNKYLMYSLQSPSLQEIIIEKSRSTAQSNLFLGPIKELPIPLPPPEEQIEIVSRVDELFEHAKAVEKQYGAAKARLDKLTQSILAKAFKGELLSNSVDSKVKSIESSIEALNA